MEHQRFAERVRPIFFRYVKLYAVAAFAFGALLLYGVFAGGERVNAADAGACDSGENRQFDFWLGQWNVRTPDGKLAGMNSISSEYGGCVLHERYSTDRGYTGESLNTYDSGRKVWHQTWVDNGGTLLVLEGGLRGVSMVLEGETVGTDGQATKHRITWTPNPDGSVRQHWESTDAKGEWSTAFDGRYTRR